MKIDMNITVIDRRHTGFGRMKYLITIPRRHVNLQSFFEIREWCWTTWGSSREIVDWIADDAAGIAPVSRSPHWCWNHDDHGPRRIYLCGDQELAFFKLRWE